MEDIQAPAEVVTNGEAAPAGAVVEQTASDLATRIGEAKTPEEVAQLTKEFFETEGQGTTDAVEAPVVDEAADEAAKAAAEAEAAQAAEAEAETARIEKEKAGKPEGKDPVAPLDPEGDASENAKGKQYRLRTKDKVEAHALVLRHRNPDLSLKECLARAEKEFAGEKPADAPADAANGMPETVEATKAKLAELRAARTKAMVVEMDLAKADSLDLEMENLRQHAVVLAQKAKEQETKDAEEQARADQAYRKEFDASNAKATGLYNFLGDETSAGFARAREIDAAMAESGDPRYYDANKPLLIAHMVAAELRIAPKSAKAPVASPAAKPAVPPKPVSMISSGGSRTTAQTTQTGQQMAQIAAVKSVEDLAKLGVHVG